MKILHVIPYFAPAWDYGGPLQVCASLAHCLAARGHEVTVYTTDTAGAHDRVRPLEETIDGVHVRRFRNLSNTLAYRYHAFLSSGMFFPPPDLRGYDVVHLHEYRTFQNAAIRAAARKQGVPYVLQAHGTIPIVMGKGLLKNTFDIFWGRRILRQARKVFAFSEFEAEAYSRAGINEGHIAIVKGGVELSLFAKLPRRGTFRERYGINQATSVILFLARLHPIKSPDLLVRSFARLRPLTDKVKLVIAGPDEGCREPVEQLVSDLGISDRVLFTGPLYNDDKLAAFVDADVYVLPSVYETFPVSVLEAMACGVPVIITDRCGLAEDIEDSAGLVVRHEEENLAQGMTQLLEDEQLRAELSAKAKTMLREKFNWEIIAAQVERLYLECLNSIDTSNAMA